MAPWSSSQPWQADFGSLGWTLLSDQFLLKTVSPHGCWKVPQKCWHDNPNLHWVTNFQLECGGMCSPAATRLSVRVGICFFLHLFSIHFHPRKNIGKRSLRKTTTHRFLDPKFIKPCKELFTDPESSWDLLRARKLSTHGGFPQMGILQDRWFIRKSH